MGRPGPTGGQEASCLSCGFAVTVGPQELDKSALVDGCNRLQAYYMVLIFQKYMVQGLTAGSVKG